MSVYVSVLRGKLTEVLLPSGFWGSNSGNHTWRWQATYILSHLIDLIVMSYMCVCALTCMCTCAFHGMNLKIKGHCGCLPQLLSTLVLIQSLSENGGCAFLATLVGLWDPGILESLSLQHWVYTWWQHAWLLRELRSLCALIKHRLPSLPPAPL